MSLDKLSKLGAASLAFGCAFLTGVVHADNPQRWVHGSWVNVRESADQNSAVIAHIIVNTPVTLRSQTDKTCEISWGTGQHGYIACKMLGEDQVRLRDVRNQNLPDNKPDPQYSPPRAFWMAPSMASLFDAGQYYRNTLLTPKQVYLENGYNEKGEYQESPSDKPPRLVRYPVAEFDAMKSVLANGIVAASDLDMPLLTCTQMRKAHDAQRKDEQTNDVIYPAWDHPYKMDYPYVYPMVNDCQLPFLPKLQLPAIKPSLFKNAKEVLPGTASIEQISAHFGITEKGRVMGAPRWERDYDISRYTGAWDIGRYELTLAKPVVEEVIGRTGLVGAYQWTPKQTLTPNGPAENCAEGTHAKRMGKSLLPDYPAVKDALFWFQTTTPLPMRRAKIAVRTEKPLKNEQEIKRVTVYEIDLNDDGIPDFVQWELWSSPQISGPDPLPLTRMLFININGEWYPFDKDIYQECT